MFENMDFKILSSFIGHRKGIKSVLISGFEKSYSLTDNETYFIIKYINKDTEHLHKFPIIVQYITTQTFYREWEREYLRKYKINKLIEKIRK